MYNQFYSGRWRHGGAMLGHGCVCNYPMFASLALYHMPAIEDQRPADVKASWKHDGRPKK